jgi:transcriptional regulator with XRE-family HTH domain
MSIYTDKHSAVVAMLTQAKNNLGYNMTDLEEKTGITRSQLYRWLNGDAKNIQQKSFQAVAHNLGYVITNTEDGIEVVHHIQNTEEDSMHEYTIKAQAKLIDYLEKNVKSQEQKIEKLNKLIETSRKNQNDNWLDIQFDVLTRQSYDKSFCNYKTYEIIKYQDFFKKLGYNNDEVDYQYENHKNEMLQSDWKYDDSTLHSTVLGSKKDDAWVMKYKNKNITLYEYLDVRMKLGKLYATYDTPVQYYHKDGHFVNAYIYCSWDLQRLTGETKIKFLEE